MDGNTHNLDRYGLEVLNSDECLSLLETRSVGRIAVFGFANPMIVPINYAVDHHTIVFRTGPGTKLWESATQDSRVAFEVDELDENEMEAWSVSLTGRAERITDQGVIARLEGLGLRNWVKGAEAFWFRVTPSIIEGRRLVQK